MPINFKPYDELFEPSYQLNYISLDGHIDVGPNTYSVFHNYTMQERQVIFQVCEKYIPWQYTDSQEDWERTMYMYQWVIKSPPPFPYEQYTLSEDIKMAISWDVKIAPINIATREASIQAIRTDSIGGSNLTFEVPRTIIDVVTVTNNIPILDEIWGKYQKYLVCQAELSGFASGLESLAKNNLEGREI